MRGGKFLSAAACPSGFSDLLGEVKLRIQSAQTRAMASVNAELVRLYWDIGRMIHQRQEREGWGASVIPRLSAELKNELPEVKGFSERNIKRMLTFYRAYPYVGSFVQALVAQSEPDGKVPQAAAKLPSAEKVPQAAAQIPESLIASIPWFHHIILIEKVKDLSVRQWYMQQTLANGWSRNVLAMMIDGAAHRRQGQAVTNFEQLLPDPQSDLVQQALKDPYIFDFLTLEEPFHEQELETGLVRHLDKFLLELGQGFAFVGRQVPVEVDGREFYIDLACNPRCRLSKNWPRLRAAARLRRQSRRIPNSRRRTQARNLRDVRNTAMTEARFHHRQEQSLAIVGRRLGCPFSFLALELKHD